MATFEKEEPSIVTEIVSAFDDIPILHRLQFVKNLLLSKIDQAEARVSEKQIYGQAHPEDPERPLILLMADGIISEIIRDYGADPALAKLGGPTS